MNEETLEVQIAGDDEERRIMMPVNYIDSHRDKTEIETEIKILLKSFHEDTKTSAHEACERMKPLDVVKIMMGVYSERANVKRYMNDGGKIWAKYQEYDYEDLYKLAHSTVNSWYID